MGRSNASDSRERVTSIATSLPEVSVQRRGNHVAYEVRGRRFAWYLDDHHGDGRLSLTCKAAGEVNHDLVRSHPDRYYMPPYVGRRGWLGYWLDGARVDWDEVGELILDAYRLVAPRGLLDELDESAP
jgi:hypothetical protein